MTEQTISYKIKPNEKQEECIKEINGKIMVLAGPGTGKTFTLINRIKNMLTSNINPESILCLTFSDAAANEMRQRLIKELGIVATKVDIYTYHSFCNSIIKAYPNQFELNENVKLINPTVSLELMKKTIDEVEPKDFVPQRSDKYFYAKDFISYVLKLKSLRISKDDYLNYLNTNPNFKPKLNELKFEVLEREKSGNLKNKTRYQQIQKIEKDIAKAQELWEIYEIYKNKMFENNYIDFQDMINFVINQFEADNLFLKEIANKYNYLMVDEYQDTNSLQNNIIFKLLDEMENKNIMVVGDDDQIIYGFQGAKLDNVENFLIKYPDTKVICLNENNRSAQNILDLSYLIINQDNNRLENNKNFNKFNITKKLIAKNNKIIEQERKIKFYQFGETMQEYNFIVENIDKLTKSNSMSKDKNNEVDLSQIAIISKKRADLSIFAELLKNKNIPYQIDEGKSIFTIRASILIYFYLKTLDNHILNSDKLFGILLSSPFEIDLNDYNRLLMEQRINQKDFITNMEYLLEKENEFVDVKKIKDFLNTFNYLKDYASKNDLYETIIEIINRTGILEYYFKSDKNKMENIMSIKKIIDEAKELKDLNPLVSINDFVKYFDEALKNEIDITIDKNNMVQNAVQLITYHGSKGREFDYVYLPNLTASSWEDFRRNGDYKFVTDEVLDPVVEQEKKDAELLKLLFVGITRAKFGLTMSFASNNNEKPQELTKYLNIAFDKKFDFENYQIDYNRNLFENEYFKFLSKDIYNHQKAFEQEIKQRINNIILSPTRLNDYLSCQRKFFYLKVLNIDIQHANWDNANYGTAIHNVLEKATNFAFQNNCYPKLEEILQWFKHNIDNSTFTTVEKKEMFQKRGIDALNDYYSRFIETPIKSITHVEYSFKNVEVKGNFISGKIDRIEKNKDGTYELYDYKTGTPVSSKKIAIGELHEDYFNQLCFYKYAFEKMTNKKVSKVGLIYVENHSKTVYKELTNKDMEYIENLIIKTYKDIKDLRFNELSKSNDICKYCAYKHLCKLEIL